MTLASQTIPEGERRVTGQDAKVCEWLEAMGIDVTDLQRVVIDIAVGEVVKVYEQRIGTDKLFVGIPDGLEITRCDVESATPPTKKIAGPQFSADSAGNPLSGFNDAAGSWPPSSPES